MKFILTANPPFDFDLTVKIFSEGDAQIQKYNDETYWRILPVDGKLILSITSSLGSVDNPKLLVTLKSDGEISSEQKGKAAISISKHLNLKLELESFYSFIKKDVILSKITRELRGLKVPRTISFFEALISSIIEQQISLNVAHSIERKIVKMFGESLSLGGKKYYVYPTPEKLALTSIQQLRGCGLSTRKSEYIRDISKNIVDGKLDLNKYENYAGTARIIGELDDIRGVGVWTAELAVIRALSRFYVIPADDLALRRTISKYYYGKKKISSEEARKTAKNWGKWKGLASFYLIVAERLNIEL